MTQLMKFAHVGFLLFGVNFLIFHLFYGLFHLDYRISISIAYATGVLLHFALHRKYTFRASSQQLAQTAGKYFLMLLLNYLLTLAVSWFVVEVGRLPPSFTVVASTTVTTGTGFFMMKYFVFLAKESE